MGLVVGLKGFNKHSDALHGAAHREVARQSREAGYWSQLYPEPAGRFRPGGVGGFASRGDECGDDAPHDPEDDERREHCLRVAKGSGRLRNVPGAVGTEQVAQVTAARLLGVEDLLLQLFLVCRANNLAKNPDRSGPMRAMR